jgi:hypothetical protein
VVDTLTVPNTVQAGKCLSITTIWNNVNNGNDRDRGRGSGSGRGKREREREKLHKYQLEALSRLSFFEKVAVI